MWKDRSALSRLHHVDSRLCTSLGLFVWRASLLDVRSAGDVRDVDASPLPPFLLSLPPFLSFIIVLFALFSLVLWSGSLVRPKVHKTVHYCEATGDYREASYHDATSMTGLPTGSIYPSKVSGGDILHVCWRVHGIVCVLTVGLFRMTRATRTRLSLVCLSTKYVFSLFLFLICLLHSFLTPSLPVLSPLALFVVDSIRCYVML